MSVIDFPNPPLVLNQSFTAGNGAHYKWNGVMWISVPAPFNTPTGPASGDLAGTYPAPTIKADVGLTGNPTAPTPLPSDNDTSIATTKFVKDQGYQTITAADLAYVNVGGDTMTGALNGTTFNSTSSSYQFNGVTVLGQSIAGYTDLRGVAGNPGLYIGPSANHSRSAQHRFENSDVNGAGLFATIDATETRSYVPLTGTDATLSGALSSVTGAFSGHVTGTTAAFNSTVTALNETISGNFTISSGTGTSSVPLRVGTDNTSNIASTAWVRSLFATRGQGAAVYQYVTPWNTTTNPGSGKLGVETVTVVPDDPNARRIAISKTDDDLVDRYLMLFLPGDSLIVTSEVAPISFYARYDITGMPVDNGTWVQMAAVFIGSQGTAPASGTRVKITGYLNTATGDGPILGVAAGEGLLGGGVAGNVELEVDFTKVAALLSPVFTGNPTLSTVIPASDNDQSLATTKFVKDQGYQTVAAADATYVNVTGDTMTGALAGTSLSMTGNITSSAGNIISTGGYVMIDRTGDANGAVFYTRADAGQAAGLYMQTGSLNRWALYKTAGAEAGSNAGSDLFLSSSDDAGVALQSVLYASRATGYVAFGLNGLPAARLHVRGTDQTVANYDPAGSQAATLYVHGTGTATGTGGAVMFGDGFGSFAAIKGYAISGTGPLGDLIVSLRKLGADTTFTEHTRFKADGGFLVAGTVAGTLGITSSGGSISTTGGSIVVDRTGDALAAYLYAIADAGQFAGTILRTGVNARWVLAKNNVAESGSNAGSDYIINSYTDAGALLGTPLTIKRSTGAVTLTGTLTGTTAAFNAPNLGTAVDSTLTPLTVNTNAGNSEQIRLHYVRTGAADWTGVRIKYQRVIDGNPQGFLHHDAGVVGLGWDGHPKALEIASNGYVQFSNNTARFDPSGYMVAQGIATTNGITAGGSPLGAISLNNGGANNTGYLGFFEPDGDRRGYIGFGSAGGTEINYNNDVGGSHYFSGGSLIATGGVSTTAVWINDNAAGNTQQLSIIGTGVNGAGILLSGNSAGGAPNKWLRSINGQFDIINNAFSAPLFIVKDDGLGSMGRSPAPSSNNTEIATTAWVRANAPAVTVSATAPATPTDGQLWFNTDASTGGGKLYIRYNDGNTVQWVPAS